MNRLALMTLVLSMLMIPGVGYGNLVDLGPEQLVQAGGADIQVLGYSVPSFVDWNNDNLNDLIIGEGSGAAPPGKVRVYLNVGTTSNPHFSNYFYAQSNGADLSITAAGCMGSFPRVVYWNDDASKDLLVGMAGGAVKIFLNVGTDENPTFDGGQTIQVGSPGSDLNVGARATPTAVDWNDDGRMDLVVGALDGKIHIYQNCGCGGAVPPSFSLSLTSGDLAEENGADLLVSSGRSSPVIMDFDGDGKKDLLTGNTNGELLLYVNVGTDAAPAFSGYSLITSQGVPIDLAGTPRSRPFACDWTGDGYLDLLVGAGDGRIHLYESVPEPATIALLGIGGLALLRRKR